MKSAKKPSSNEGGFFSLFTFVGTSNTFSRVRGAVDFSAYVDNDPSAILIFNA